MWRLYKLRRMWVVFRLRLRDGGQECAYCYCEFTGQKSRQRTLDHVLALSLGGTWRVSNLVFACAACNRQKGNGRLSDFYWSEWLRTRRNTMEREKIHPKNHTVVASVT